jgi:hypothetical protein
VRNDQIDIQPDEFSDELDRKARSVLRPAIFDREIAAFDPAEFAQPLLQESRRSIDSADTALGARHRSALTV